MTVTGKNYDAMADLVRKHKLNIAGHTGKKAGRGRYVVDMFADSNQIERLKSEGYRVDVREDGFKVALEATLEYSGAASMPLSIPRPRPPIAM